MKRLPGQRSDPLGVAPEGWPLRSALAGVPQLDGAVHRSGDEEFGIRRPCDAEHPARVAFASKLRGFCREVPEPDGAVAGARGELAAVRAEAGGEDGLVMPCKLARRMPGMDDEQRFTWRTLKTDCGK
jgi:hypothetical protein